LSRTKGGQRALLAFLTTTTVVLTANPAPTDQTLPIRFKNDTDGFDISFPDGWTQMAFAKMQKLNQLGEAQSPGSKRPFLKYAYEMTNSAGLDFPPYVLIRVANSSSPPNPLAVQADMESDEALKHNLHRDKPIFDEELNAFVQTYRFTNSGVPFLEGTVAYFLTKKSIIKMFFYAPITEDGRLTATVQQIIRNVYTYKEPNPPSGSRTGLLIGLVAIAAIVLVLARAKPAK